MRIISGSGKRAIEHIMEEKNSPIVSHPGACGPGKCVGETACKQNSNNTYTCICTHTSDPPLANGICPRKIEKKSPIVFHPGSCGPGKCVGETACKQNPNNTYTCICTHTSDPPTANGVCPRKIVTQDKIVFQPKIPVQPPPKTDGTPLKISQNATMLTKNQPAATETAQSLSSYVIPGILGTIIIVIFAMLIYFFRLKAKRRNDAESPINLKHSLLIPERYAPNPQYSACCSTDVPVIRKETLKFLNELGEGCFGKVFKEWQVRNGIKAKIDSV